MGTHLDGNRVLGKRGVVGVPDTAGPSLDRSQYPQHCDRVGFSVIRGKRVLALASAVVVAAVAHHPAAAVVVVAEFDSSRAAEESLRISYDTAC